MTTGLIIFNLAVMASMYCIGYAVGFKAHADGKHHNEKTKF